MKQSRYILRFLLVITAIITLVWAVNSIISAIENEYMAVWGATNSSEQNPAQQIAATNSLPSLVSDGKNALKENGYDHSLPLVVRQRVLRSCLIPLLVLLVVVILTVFAWVSDYIHLKHDNKHLTQELLLTGREKQVLQQEVQKTINEVDQYEGNLYHQLKTPLTSIRLELENSGRSDGNGIRLLDKTSRLLQLLLREKQFSAAQDKMRYIPIVLNDLLDDAVQQTKPDAFEVEKHVTLHLPQSECILVCDELWLSECMIVLLENAIEHADKKKDIVVSLSEQDGYYHIDVISTGMIPELDTGRNIFERFYTSNIGHFGIGLHMAQEIAAAHHGSLSAMNHPQDNTVSFNLVLPILQDERAYSVTGL